MSETHATEYAVEVDGVGWLFGADSIGKEYRRLGQPHMVAQIRIVSRVVTTSRGDWGAPDADALDQARTMKRLGIGSGGLAS